MWMGKCGVSNLKNNELIVKVGELFLQNILYYGYTTVIMPIINKHMIHDVCLGTLWTFFLKKPWTLVIEAAAAAAVAAASALASRSAKAAAKAATASAAAAAAAAATAQDAEESVTVRGLKGRLISQGWMIHFFCFGMAKLCHFDTSSRSLLRENQKDWYGKS